MITLIMILDDHSDQGRLAESSERYAQRAGDGPPPELTRASKPGYNAGMSDLTSTIASLQRRVEEIAVHL
jgi:hypothetical protein